MTMMQGLPLTGVSASINAKKRGELWMSNCETHVKSLHKLLSSIYDGLESDHVYEDESDDVTIESGNSASLSQIFADHCYKLVNLLSSPTREPVGLPLSRIITVLTRCLRVSYADVEAIPSRSDLLQLLPGLHQSCMDVIARLILCCGSDILPNSHTIIDMCLQNLASTGKMSPESRCRTRSSIYQALVLWIRTLGWGRYLTQHCKLLIQELVADTHADEEEKISKKSLVGDSSSKNGSLIPSRKRKRDKKKGRKADAYIELETEDSKTKEPCSAERLDTTQWAHTLSQLMVESLSFSASQTLVAHIVKTASTVQRLSLDKPPPYSHGQARKALYQSLASCLLSPLDYGCNRNVAVGHYQMTNSALDLLARGCHGEESQVVAVCSHALDIVRSSANLKGPVIRKVSEFEDTEVEDISQLMRERQEMEDKLEGLRHKLTNSEVENEQQSRLIASLREQVAKLEAQELTKTVDSPQGSGRVKSCGVDSESNEQSSDEEEEKDKTLKEHKTNNKTQEKRQKDCNREDTSTSSLPDNGEGLNTPTVGEKSTPPDHTAIGMDLGPTTSQKTTLEVDEEGATNEQTEKMDDPNEYEASTSSEKLSKPVSPIDDSAHADAKRSKTDSNQQDLKEKGGGLEDMLLDFVDAPPDS